MAVKCNCGAGELDPAAKSTEQTIVLYACSQTTAMPTDVKIKVDEPEKLSGKPQFSCKRSELYTGWPDVVATPFRELTYYPLHALISYRDVHAIAIDQSRYMLSEGERS